jgi:thiamine-phosphate pyrophosphorylase
MPARQTLPRLWLMTDERIGAALDAAIARVPRGGGVVLRHHRSDPALGERVASLCRERGLMLAVAGDVAFARQLRAAMVHNPVADAGDLLVSRSVHSRGEALAARGADMVFVSPLFPSASHSDRAGVGIEEALTLARLAGAPAIALGGMDAARGAAAVAAGFHGWAAIDAWLEDPLLRS